MEIADAAGKAAQSARTRALSDWLSEHLAEAWSDSLRDWGIEALGAVASCGPRDLWRIYLPALQYARQLQAASEQRLQLNAPGVPRILGVLPNDRIRSARPVVVLGDQPAVADDLKLAWHPSMEGAAIRAVSDDPAGEARRRLQSARELIASASPRSFEMVDAEVGAICVVEPDPPQPAGVCVSLTSKLVPGLIYMSSVPTILGCESIVHEAAHLVLSRIEVGNTLFADPSRLVRTPLRPDPRPISGLMHQVWVLTHLLELYADLLGANDEVILANQGKVSKRLEQHRSDLDTGLFALRQSEDCLTPLGRSFIEHVESRREGAAT